MRRLIELFDMLRPSTYSGDDYLAPRVEVHRIRNSAPPDHTAEDAQRGRHRRFGVDPRQMPTFYTDR